MKIYKILCQIAFMCLSFAYAEPRVGQHDGYTRIVFELPKASSAKAAYSDNKLEVSLDTELGKDSGNLSAAGLIAYAINGKTVTLDLSEEYAGFKASTLSDPPRLVIDISTKEATAQATPAATITTTSARRPKVVLDAGHGGIDPGMVSKWVTEKEVTLSVARKVRSILLDHGVDVTMVRSSDTQLSRDKATDLDMRSGMATTGSVSAYVAIHVNAGNSSAEGIETYYFGQPIAGSNRSLAVLENGGGSVGLTLTKKAASKAQNMLGDILAQAKVSFSRQLAYKVQGGLISSTGAYNRGVHTDAFYVIRDPKTAAILTEIGFGSSTREGPLLASEAYRTKIATGIAGAILDFLHIK